MTNEEIKKIEAAINFVDYCTPAETNEDVELAGIAIEALEKQIPKKPLGGFDTESGKRNIAPIAGKL